MNVIDETFTLTQETDVYAGFVMTENAVGFFGGGVTDHNGAPPLAPLVGVELPEFTNNNLGRSYSFGINVSAIPVVPEPSAMALASICFFSLGFVGWRRGNRS